MPFQFNGLPWRNSELSEMLVQFFYEFASENARNAGTIAWRRTPHTPIIQLIENMIRRSSTPDVSQTSLSIYQFKSALSRKSAPSPPSAFTSFRRPCIRYKRRIVLTFLSRISGWDYLTVRPEMEIW